ncbi:MAG: NFACT RNA binding domain-containing protein [Thermodesulfobacteriota bacterium]|nr:NFACT RNA binding domain-containing protein [Thermodesulfobacteriota bacterium]
MKLDLIKSVVAELAEPLVGARISKIYQPAPEILIFKLWNGRETLRLLLSAEVQKSRLHLTERTWPNPHIPPRFCQLLRARITRIHSVSVVNNDRIIQLECTGRQGACRLLVELTGTRSNLILVDDRGGIIDVLKRIKREDGRRVVLPGQDYVFPEKNNPEDKIAPQSPVMDMLENSWNQYVEKLYSGGEHTENKLDFSRQLQQAINRQMKKLRKRLISIETDFQQQQNFDTDRQIGELLLANLLSVHRGMTEIVLQNYYLQPPETVNIILDPLLKPQQNVEKYFNRYKKRRRGQEHSQRRLREAEAEIEWLEQLDYQLKDSVINTDIEEIAQELRQAGLLKEKNRLHNKRTLQPSKPHEATSPSGYKIFWGRNNRQNDEISTKNLVSGDRWFHAYRVPGAHVVMKIGNTGELVTDADLNYAASIAAGYSKSRHDHKVEVMVAGSKSVHKPKGGRAGLVNVLQYKTLLVKPFRPE